MRHARFLATAMTIAVSCQAYDRDRYNGLAEGGSAPDALDGITIDHPDDASTDTPASDVADVAADLGSDVPADIVADTRSDCALRSGDDRADEATGYQIHVVYVIPSDGTDRSLDTNGVIRTSVAAWTRWFTAQTGGPRLRVDTCGGAPDVTFFRMSATDATVRARGAFVREAIEEELTAAGRIASGKLYAVYYDGTSDASCGGGAYPPTLMGRVAAIYLQGAPAGSVPCSTNALAPSEASPGYFEFVMLQTMLHSLGLAGSCAPHYVNGGGTSDSDNDVLYLGSGAWRLPAVLDVNRDDYFGHHVSGCIDLANSVFLEPSTTGAAPPPGW